MPAHASGTSMKERSDHLATVLLEFLPGEIFRDLGPCALAVSGGRDSILMMHCFAALWRRGLLRTAPVVFHLHHGLRPEADRDLDFVLEEARRVDLSCYYEQRSVSGFARRAGLGVEEAGRVLRYRGLGRVLRRLGPGALAVTAHHADDYIESVLLHLIRGGGPGALGTLPVLSRVEGVPVFRPLLGLSRARISELARNLEFVEDATNVDLSFTRNRVRAELTPRLYAEGLDPVRVWRNFHEDPALAFASGMPVAPLSHVSLDRRLWAGAGAGELKRLLDPALRRLGLSPADRAMLGELLRRQVGQGPAFRQNYRNARLWLWADRDGPVWLFRRDGAALRPANCRNSDASDDTRRLVIYNDRVQELVVAAGEQVVVFQPGMRCPLPGGGHKKLREVFQEAGLPLPVRARLPLVMDRATGRVTRVCFSFWERGRDRIFRFPGST